MRFDIVTIFPEFFRGPLDHGIVRRAQDSGLVQVHIQDLREFTHDRHRTVDDRPFGGGEGMVLKPEPLFAAVEHLLGRAAESVGADAEGERPQRHSPSQTAIVLLSASGKLFRQETARRLAQLDRVILLCGRYEGVDERVAEHLATDELSIGDFVVSGGELPAALILDAVTRLIPGALGNEDSTTNDSFSEIKNVPFAELADPSHQLAIGWDLNTPLMKLLGLAAREAHYSPGLLDFPHYTRPAEFRGWKVPDELISGHHAQVRRWRRKMALAKTFRNRPELLARPGVVEAEDEELIKELAEEQKP